MGELISRKNLESEPGPSAVAKRQRHRLLTTSALLLGFAEERRHVAQEQERSWPRRERERVQHKAGQGARCEEVEMKRKRQKREMKNGGGKKETFKRETT